MIRAEPGGALAAGERTLSANAKSWNRCESARTNSRRKRQTFYAKIGRPQRRLLMIRILAASGRLQQHETPGRLRHSPVNLTMFSALARLTGAHRVGASAAPSVSLQQRQPHRRLCLCQCLIN